MLKTYRLLIVGLIQAALLFALFSIGAMPPIAIVFAATACLGAVAWWALRTARPWWLAALLAAYAVLQTLAAPAVSLATPAPLLFAGIAAMLAVGLVNPDVSAALFSAA